MIDDQLITLVYPTDTPANMTNTGTFAYLSCKDITRRLMTQKSVMQTDENLAYNVQYPHNLLRNIAREGALTEFDLGRKRKAKLFLTLYQLSTRE